MFGCLRSLILPTTVSATKTAVTCCLKRQIVGHRKHSALLIACCGQRRQLTNGGWIGGDQYEVVEPHEWTPHRRHFAADIQRPDYADTGVVAAKDPNVLIKSKAELIGIAEACKVAKTILNEVGQQLTVGVTGEDIDDMVYDLCQKYRCYPSPLNYNGFPKCVTTSVNNVAVHGIPDRRELVAGDVITVDVSVYYKGFHGDCAHTYPIGDYVSDSTYHLINVGQLALYEAINVCRDGVKLSAIGRTIESLAKEYGYSVIGDFCGHGIGRQLHELPQVLHIDHPSSFTLKENMCITIEPVITEGSDKVATDSQDGWSVLTVDNRRTVQFEHTICITRDGAIILTEID
ncbi:methionine aminopeptidase 1D, mitochondrial-like [Oppia nitens]|uniref:methionine aminopeptidase 1D, mitochondrial-like n=1 Tax=Oppia nitens TaxID=1686743 RepID=UPI0023DC8F8C|nr:methionine aminopeptidase 1D, mitochondrial-like [Oppia nitens]